MSNVTCGSSWQRLAEMTFSYGGLSEYKILLTRSNIRDEHVKDNASDSSDDDTKDESAGEIFGPPSNLNVPEPEVTIHTMGFKFEKECVEEDRKRRIARFDLQVNSKHGSSLKMRIKHKQFREMSLEINKYWHMRRTLFSKFDSGIQLDQESWFSVTPELLARHTALRLKHSVVIDAFCGAGGNTIQLAMVCDKVIAIDVDPKKIKMARNNARIYGVEHKILFINKDFLNFVTDSRSRADAVFVSPPWGGPGYRNKDTFSLKAVTPDIDAIMEKAKSISKNIALFLPRNTAVEELVKYSEAEPFEVEQNVISGRLKAVTVYYGNLINRKTDPISATNLINDADCAGRNGHSTWVNLDQSWRTDKNDEDKFKPIVYKNFNTRAGTYDSFRPKRQFWDEWRGKESNGVKLDCSVEDKLALPPRQYTNFATATLRNYRKLIYT